jgi:hypothetical protein
LQLITEVANRSLPATVGQAEPRSRLEF